MSTPLFKQLVQASGLSPIFAEGALKRALERGGTSPDGLTAHALRKAMPEVRKCIEGFLQDGTPTAMARIEHLLAGQAA